MTTTFVIAVSIADIHLEPDAASELVTQALLNVPVIPGDTSGDWTHVTLADYSGWIRSDELEDPIVRGFCEGIGTCGVALPFSCVVTAPRAPLYLDKQGEETVGDLYLSTVLPFIDLAHPQRFRLALPGDGEGWIERENVEVRNNHELFLQQPLTTVTEYAKSFLGVPYLWGGTSYRGIDCSGLVQLCYRMGGEILPRDADQQFNFLKQAVELLEMQEGDLLFFGREHITHVAMALNAREYIHSEGQNFNRVLINSFDPASPAYYPELAERLWGIKRVRNINES